MRKLLLILAASVAVPFTAMANELNADYVALGIIDNDVGDGFGAEARFGISRNGKVVAGYQDVSTTFFGTDIGVSSISLGYRHTLTGVTTDPAMTVAVSGGLIRAEAEAGGVSASETDFYIASDLEYLIGPGVAHGEIAFVAGDFGISGGYTYYFTPNFGARGELELGGADTIFIGGVAKF